MKRIPRLQVEHAVTEETIGLDLVRAQIALAQGASLTDLGLDPPPLPRGVAIEWRIVAEPGRLTRFRPPSGPGLRVDACAAEGEEIGAGYDPLVAKLIVRGADLADAQRRSRRALAEWEIEGAATNLGILRSLAEEDLAAFALDTLDRRLETLPVSGDGITAPLTGRVVEIAADGPVAAGATVAVVEAMKMEYVVAAPASGRLTALARVGDQVTVGTLLARLDEAQAGAAPTAPAARAGPRADLARLRERWAATQDSARPVAIAKRHALGLRTARENVADLVDPGSFQEYGAFAVAAQTSRRTLADLIADTPADGIVAGTGLVDGASIAVFAYDATVLAGTQGLRGHEKTDRLLEIAARRCLPVVLFAEGGGGRPGDTDAHIVAGLHLTTFARFAGLSGRAPLIGIVAGRCFAGNAALLGCCDVIISTRDANIGMGGPAMIEGGGLGRFRPRKSAPSPCRRKTASSTFSSRTSAKPSPSPKPRLAYFTRAAQTMDGDPEALRGAIPENRVRAYDMRALDARRARCRRRAGAAPRLAPGLITALGRVEGRAIGVLANDPACTSAAPSSAGAPQGRALPAALRRVRVARALADATRRASWSGRRSSAAATCAPARECSSLRARRCPSSLSWCGAATASARWRWPAADFMRPISQSPGRAASSGRWASKARCGSATAARWRRRRRCDPRGFVQAPARRASRARRGDQHGGGAGDRRRHRPRRDANLDRPRLAERTCMRLLASCLRRKT